MNSIRTSLFDNSSQVPWIHFNIEVFNLRLTDLPGLTKVALAFRYANVH